MDQEYPICENYCFCYGNQRMSANSRNHTVDEIGCMTPPSEKRSYGLAISYDKFTEEADGDILPSMLRHSREGGNLQTNWPI